MASQSSFIKVVFVLVICLTAGYARCQGIYATASLESTSAGLRFGPSIGYQSKKYFQAGVFYQRAFTSENDQTFFSQTFTGIETLISVVRTEKIRFSFQARLGIANNQFVAIVPGARTYLRMFKNLEAAVGMQWRFNRPALEIALHRKF